MERISQAIAAQSGKLTRGHRLLATFVGEHCEKAAFMTSFELASVTGVSQSTVIRFAMMLGYSGYAEFQEAMREELKYRLNVLERFEVIRDISTDEDLVGSIAVTDARNIKKTLGYNSADAMGALTTRLMLASKVYLYGQGYASAAAAYFAAHLGLLGLHAIDLNQSGLGPVGAMSGIGSGDLLIILGFPPHGQAVRQLIQLARQREAFVVTVSEGFDSEIGREADLSLISEWGEWGVNGSMAPVISLCCAAVCLLARKDAQAEKKLRLANEVMQLNQ